MPESISTYWAKNLKLKAKVGNKFEFSVNIQNDDGSDYVFPEGHEAFFGGFKRGLLGEGAFMTQEGVSTSEVMTFDTTVEDGKITVKRDGPFTPMSGNYNYVLFTYDPNEYSTNLDAIPETDYLANYHLRLGWEPTNNQPSIPQNTPLPSDTTSEYYYNEIYYYPGDGSATYCSNSDWITIEYNSSSGPPQTQQSYNIFITSVGTIWSAGYIGANPDVTDYTNLVPQQFGSDDPSPTYVPVEYNPAYGEYLSNFMGFSIGNTSDLEFSFFSDWDGAPMVSPHYMDNSNSFIGNNTIIYRKEMSQFYLKAQCHMKNIVRCDFPVQAEEWQEYNGRLDPTISVSWCELSNNTIEFNTGNYPTSENIYPSGDAIPHTTKWIDVSPVTLPIPWITPSNQEEADQATYRSTYGTLTEPFWELPLGFTTSFVGVVTPNQDYFTKPEHNYYENLMSLGYTWTINHFGNILNVPSNIDELMDLPIEEFQSEVSTAVYNSYVPFWWNKIKWVGIEDMDFFNPNSSEQYALSISQLPGLSEEWNPFNLATEEIPFTTNPPASVMNFFMPTEEGAVGEDYFNNLGDVKIKVSGLLLNVMDYDVENKLLDSNIKCRIRVELVEPDENGNIVFFDKIEYLTGFKPEHSHVWTDAGVDVYESQPPFFDEDGNSLLHMDVLPDWFEDVSGGVLNKKSRDDVWENFIFPNNPNNIQPTAVDYPGYMTSIRGIYHALWSIENLVTSVPAGQKFRIKYRFENLKTMTPYQGEMSPPVYYNVSAYMHMGQASGPSFYDEMYLEDPSSVGWSMLNLYSPKATSGFQDSNIDYNAISDVEFNLTTSGWLGGLDMWLSGDWDGIDSGVDGDGNIVEEPFPQELQDNTWDEYGNIIYDGYMESIKLHFNITATSYTKVLGDDVGNSYAAYFWKPDAPDSVEGPQGPYYPIYLKIFNENTEQEFDMGNIFDYAESSDVLGYRFPISVTYSSSIAENKSIEYDNDFFGPDGIGPIPLPTLIGSPGDKLIIKLSTGVLKSVKLGGIESYQDNPGEGVNTTGGSSIDGKMFEYVQAGLVFTSGEPSVETGGVPLPTLASNYGTNQYNNDIMISGNTTLTFPYIDTMHKVILTMNRIEIKTWEVPVFPNNEEITLYPSIVNNYTTRFLSTPLCYWVDIFSYETPEYNPNYGRFGWSFRIINPTTNEILSQWLHYTEWDINEEYTVPTFLNVDYNDLLESVSGGQEYVDPIIASIQASAEDTLGQQGEWPMQHLTNDLLYDSEGNGIWTSYYDSPLNNYLSVNSIYTPTGYYAKIPSIPDGTPIQFQIKPQKHRKFDDEIEGYLRFTFSYFGAAWSNISYISYENTVPVKADYWLFGDFIINK